MCVTDTRNVRVHASGGFGCSVCEYMNKFSFNHRVSLAVLWQILWRVIPRGCVLRQHGIRGHGSGLWRSFNNVACRYMFCDGSGWVCQWCLVISRHVCCEWWWCYDLSTYHLTHIGVACAALRRESVFSDFAHTHMCCRSKESVVTVPLPGSFSDYTH